MVRYYLNRMGPNWFRLDVGCWRLDAWIIRPCKNELKKINDNSIVLYAIESLKGVVVVEEKYAVA